MNKKIKTVEDVRKALNEWLARNKCSYCFVARKVDMTQSTLHRFATGEIARPLNNTLNKIMKFIQENPDFTQKRKEEKEERCLRLNQELTDYFKNNELVTHLEVYTKMEISAVSFYKFFNHLNASSNILDIVEAFLRGKK